MATFEQYDAAFFVDGKLNPSLSNPEGIELVICRDTMHAYEDLNEKEIAQRYERIRNLLAARRAAILQIAEQKLYDEDAQLAAIKEEYENKEPKTDDEIFHMIDERLRARLSRGNLSAAIVAWNLTSDAYWNNLHGVFSSEDLAE